MTTKNFGFQLRREKPACLLVHPLSRPAGPSSCASPLCKLEHAALALLCDPAVTLPDVPLAVEALGAALPDGLKGIYGPQHGFFVDK